MCETVLLESHLQRATASKPWVFNDYNPTSPVCILCALVEKNTANSLSSITAVRSLQDFRVCMSFGEVLEISDRAIVGERV